MVGVAGEEAGGEQGFCRFGNKRRNWEPWKSSTVNVKQMIEFQEQILMHDYDDM
jgi:hypothetical protein